jgi:glycosyltransferase 2 family protein
MARIMGERALVKRAALGVVGVGLGGFFFWLALRNISRGDIESALGQLTYGWLATGILIYMASIALRCLRWGILLRASGAVRWRHVAEALIIGYAANYLLPARLGELFRADYARRLFSMSRFTSLGTIVVERMCDGVILVAALWVSLALVVSPGAGDTSWMTMVGLISSVLFGAALVFVIWSRRIDLHAFGLPDFIAVRWARLTEGISSVARGRIGVTIACSFGIWVLEVLALGSIVRAFDAAFSVPQTVVLVGLASLSTLIPTAPGYLGTYQFVFSQVFALFGHPPSIGVVAATTVQVFCFGGVTVLGIFLLLSRSGVELRRALAAGDRSEMARR